MSFILPRHKTDRADRISVKLDLDVSFAELGRRIVGQRGIGAVTPKRRQAIDVLAANLWVAVQKNLRLDQYCAVAVSRRHDKTAYKDRGFGFKDVLWAIDRLIAVGLATSINGVFTVETRRTSRLCPSLRLYALMDGLDSEPTTKAAAKAAEAALMIPSGAGHDQIVADLHLINQVNKAHRYQYIPLTTSKSDRERDYSNLPCPLPYLTATKIYAESLDYSDIGVENVLFNRYYNDLDLKKYGRFCARIQSLRRLERQSLLIDGEQTVEADFGSMYVGLLYNRANAVLSADPYDLGVESRSTRKIAKKAFLAIIGAKSLTDAAKAIQHEINQGTFETDLSGRDICLALINRHPAISNYFFANESGYMQYLESSIANEIMITFARLNKPIIGIHDSFRVKAADGQLLLETMTDCYKKVLEAELRRPLAFLPKIDLK